MDRLLLYNRCDHTAGRAAQIKILLSSEGREFQLVYQHNGKSFLGQPDGKPLAVPLRGAARSARGPRS